MACHTGDEIGNEVSITDRAVAAITEKIASLPELRKSDKASAGQPL
jgi:hypothetical protein